MLRNLSSRSNCGHTGLVLELWIKLPNGGFNLANIFRMQIYRQHSFPMATAWKVFPSTFIGGKNNGCRHGKLQLNHQMEKQRVGRAVIELFNGVCKSPIQGQNKSSDISSVYRSCNWLQLLCIVAVWLETRGLYDVPLKNVTGCGVCISKQAALHFYGACMTSQKDMTSFIKLPSSCDSCNLYLTTQATPKMMNCHL